MKKIEFDYGGKGEGLKGVSKEISWLKGWPKSRRAFWNGEAFMWRNKIEREKRELIKKELMFLEERGRRGRRNLDLGCGSYSYITSVGLDISEKMLLLNDNLQEKVLGDLEKKLPFRKGEFDSVTMVFVLDYIRNYWNLLKEVFRVLKEKGVLVVVQSRKKGKGIWEKQRRNNFRPERWGKILREVGFKVDFYEKEGLGFFKCRKK